MRFLSSRAVIVLWTLALLAICIAITFGKPGKLYRTFAAAGDHFLHGQQIYIHVVGKTESGGPKYELVMSERLDLYRYSPLIAASFVPWSFLPESVGAILWRCLQAIALLLALRAWARIAVPSVPWPARSDSRTPAFGGQLLQCASQSLGCGPDARRRGRILPRPLLAGGSRDHAGHRL